MSSKTKNLLLTYISTATKMFQLYYKMAKNLKTKNLFFNIKELLTKKDFEIKEKIILNLSDLKDQNHFLVFFLKRVNLIFKSPFGLVQEALKSTNTIIYKLNKYINKYKNVIEDDLTNIALFLLEEFEKIEKDIKEHIKNYYL